MLIKLTDGTYIDHRTVLLVEKEEIQYSGSNKTVYRLDVVMSKGSYDDRLTIKYDSYAKRDKEFAKLIEKVNTELDKDRKAFRGEDRFSLVGLNKEKQDDV